ncbi:hypothetical protein [Amycolatopsis sp. La24]|uniref:hypothetical protein n=1 Tax=Amycolatopsis sp. La24 TaxID=3028304 RepID=UPI0023B15CBB|nr:hypothetical protein [Amycolatopsis sp. La24]
MSFMVGSFASVLPLAGGFTTATNTGDPIRQRGRKFLRRFLAVGLQPGHDGADEAIDAGQRLLSEEWVEVFDADRVVPGLGAAARL